MLDLSSLQKAVDSLEEGLFVYEKYAIGEDVSLKRTLQAGVIQNFEFTYELCWKFMKRWLAENLGKSAVDGLSRRALFRLSVEYSLIESVDAWMIFHRARNETSHTYDEKTALEVFDVAQRFLPSVARLLLNLKEKQ